jgi:predicted transposase YbfD/YdcC
MLDVFMDAFADLPEPRVHENKIRHKLLDIVAITVCAVMSGVDEWWFVADYGRVKEPWLRQFLELPSGIPSHDTFSRVFSLIDPEAFTACFVSWVQSMATTTEGRIVPIDGKTLRASNGGDGPLHLVSAFCTENALVLGQLATEEKSNEITAIPRLLDLLNIEDAIITIDAMGAQKDIVDKICDKGADYVIGLKTNQPKLHDAVEEHFEGVHLDTEAADDLDVHVIDDNGHGRERVQGTFVSSDLSGICMREEWTGLRSIVMVITEQIDKNGRLGTEKRYYLSSCGQDAREAARAVRSHWHIENKLHWVLDVTFREDSSQIKRDNGAQNLAVIRHAALNLFRQSRQGDKISLRGMAKRCSYDTDYLPRMLFGD